MKTVYETTVEVTGGRNGTARSDDGVLISISTLAEKLYLQSNTLTPLLKRMEDMDLVSRVRSQRDERSVVISLTPKSKQLQSEAPQIRNQLLDHIGLDLTEAQQLYSLLYKVINGMEI